MQKLKQAANLVANMGFRYVAYRAGYILKKKAGLLLGKYPTSPPDLKFLSVAEWKNLDKRFFFNFKKDLIVPVDADPALQFRAEKMLQGKFTFFSNLEYDLGKNYDWLTNPDNQYRYESGKHWLEVNDYSKEAGDIKFVWEKSRFSYLYTLIRYDYHFRKDLSSFVFNEIESWIDANPINRGPNYKCSQEISLRVLNWTFALHYYRDSPVLTQSLFDKIINSIYWQTRHVFSNINFSRIAVRNNHAITETLTLYLVGLLYPFFAEAEVWKQKGKHWFEQEIAYQIYPDGTFLQFSMNYHRVVIQLLTWGLSLARLNNERFDKVVYERAEASVDFLTASLNETDGHLPNYGNNDGALFFPLCNNDFRDYRPQLEALSIVLGKPCNYGEFEDKYWYGLQQKEKVYMPEPLKESISSFKDGGYFICRETRSLTFIRCGNYKDRPFQADNLHLDLWADGINILRDSGSYKYNTDEKTLGYFFGTASHNTVMLGDYDQMLKGNRFIWYYWTGPASGEWKEEQDYYEFVGKIKAFKHVGKNIIHERRVRKFKDRLKWEIIDKITGAIDLPIVQIWNPNEHFEQRFTIQAMDYTGRRLLPDIKTGWYSGYYGQREETNQILFRSNGKYIHTIIEAKEQADK